MSVFALCQSACSMCAADAVLDELFKDNGRPKSIIWTTSIDTQSAVVQAFSQLAVLIDSRLSEANHCRLVGPPATVLVDHVRAGYLCPWSDSASWEAVIALLLLAFPDVNWIFMSGFILESAHDVDGHHRLSEIDAIDLLRTPRPNPLFDGIGLREFVRRSPPKNEKAENPIVAKRTVAAAAIEDEEMFAMYHAYVAYRQGYRAEAIVRFAHMERYFRNKEGKIFNLVMQDQSLNFPDKPHHKHLSNLSERNKEFPLLERADASVLVTSGQDGMTGDGTIGKNIVNLERTGQSSKPILKPVGDMLDFWSQVKNRAPSVSSSDKPIPDSVNHRYLAQTQSPPRQSAPNDDTSHAAPGRLMLVAATLIQRAKSLKQQNMDAMTSIRGAVFATDALELLAGRTPTMSWEALALKHEFEVQAETSFIGCGYHASTDRETTRRNEIESDCGSIANWLHPSSREWASLNAQMQIAGALIRHYRSVGQFEEETEYANWAGDIEWKLKVLNSRTSSGPTVGTGIARAGASINPRYWYNWAARHYYLRVLQTPKKVCIGIGVWLLLLGVGFWLSGVPRDNHWCYVSDAITSFFSLGAPYSPQGSECADPNQQNGWYAGVVALSIALGTLHLGTLVALFVSRMSRK